MLYCTSIIFVSMLIALSDNWQRVGDMLAKTIVVEDKEKILEAVKK
jgi:uncharacterized RDD family membrane protein YckC